jgi:hypothetical protein
MAQSAVTVTPPNPTPPTNMSSTGTSAPNPPNYTKATYADMQDNMIFNTAPPPYYDDAAGGVGAGLTFQASTAALASGTGATSGGTENTYPGTGGNTGPGTGGNFLGAVPASSSATAEGAGTETNWTKSTGTAADYGVDPKKYGPNVLVPIPMVTVGSGPTQTAATIAAGPNASHASTLSPTVAPTLTSIASIASGAGNGNAVCTGTGFTPQSVVYVSGVAYPTTFTSATSITGVGVPKRASAGTLPVYVVTGGSIVTATVNWTFT